MDVWKISREGDSTIWSVGPTYEQLQPIADFPLDYLRFVRPVVGGARPSPPTFTRTPLGFNTRVAPTDVCGADTLVDDFNVGIDEVVVWGRRADGRCKLAAVNGGVELTNNQPEVGSTCSLGASGI